MVLHPKFPRFDWYFSDNYRIFPTATEFFSQLPNFTDRHRFVRQPGYRYRFLSTKNVQFFPTYSYVPTSELVSPVLAHPLPFSRPSPADPVTSCPPSGPPLPDSDPPMPTESPDSANFCPQLPNFADSYRILPTESPNFADSYHILRTATEFYRNKNEKQAHLFTVSTF